MFAPPCYNRAGGEGESRRQKFTSSLAETVSIIRSLSSCADHAGGFGNLADVPYGQRMCAIEFKRTMGAFLATVTQLLRWRCDKQRAGVGRPAPAFFLGRMIAQAISKVDWPASPANCTK